MSEHKCVNCGREYDQPEGTVYVEGVTLDLCHPMMSTGPTCYSTMSRGTAEVIARRLKR